MPSPDETFSREGRSLRQWLHDLLGPDPVTRRRAENVVSAMWWGAPVADTTIYLHLPPDPDAHRNQFAEAIGAILADPAFPGRQFVESALNQMKNGARRQHDRFEMEERLLDRIFDEENDAKTEQEATEKIAAARAEEDVGRLPNSFGPHTLHMVIECAGPILLDMPETVRRALLDDTCARSIAKALWRLGPAAVAFASDLLHALGAQIAAASAFPEVLASVARDDPATVRKLLDLVTSGNTDAAWRALEVLRSIGRDAVRLMPGVVDALLPMGDDSDQGVSVLRCLASVAPDRRDVFDRVLDAARPRPPDIREAEGFPGYTFDANMGRRGPAIEALGHFEAFADEAVSVLTDAIDTFEEYDSDWGYENGEHGRVVTALSRLVPASVAAVPTLVKHLRDEDENGDIDWRIIRFFGQLGPAAHAALPALRRLQEELHDVDDSDASEPPDEMIDPLAWAIYRITTGGAG